MELKITGTEQEIYSMLSKFQVSKTIDTISTNEVEQEIQSIIRIDEPKDVGTEKKNVHRWRKGKRTTLLIDWQVFKKFITVKAAADFIGVSDACLYAAAKIWNKVDRLYHIHIEWYDNSIKEIPDTSIL